MKVALFIGLFVAWPLWRLVALAWRRRREEEERGEAWRLHIARGGTSKRYEEWKGVR